MCYLQKNKIKFRNEKSSSHEDGKNQKNDGKQEAKNRCQVRFSGGYQPISYFFFYYNAY